MVTFVPETTETRHAAGRYAVEFVVGRPEPAT